MSTRSRTQAKGRGTPVPAPGGAGGQPAGGAAVAAPRPRRSGIAAMLRRGSERPLWMLIPCAIAMVIVVLIPVILVVVLSLLKLNIFTLHEWLAAPFSGIRNYVSRSPSGA